MATSAEVTINKDAFLKKVRDDRVTDPNDLASLLEECTLEKEKAPRYRYQELTKKKYQNKYPDMTQRERMKKAYEDFEKKSRQSWFFANEARLRAELSDDSSSSDEGEEVPDWLALE